MKSISGSVGVNGKNNSRDVMIVQYLLNCVPGVKGGPDAELAVDGMCGQLTCAAIGKFQKKQMGWGDGRVDPNGKTIASLNNFDPFPAHDPFVGGGASKLASTGRAKPGKHGGSFGSKQGAGGSGKQGTGGGHVLHDHPGAKHTGKNSSDFPSKGAPQDFPSKFGHGKGGGKHSDTFRPGSKFPS